MCGRFASPEGKAIARFWHIGRHSNPNPFARRFNVFPTDTIAFIRRPSNSSELELAAGRWGLVPHWWKEAKPPKTSFIARVEEAAGKPMLRDAWSRARCLIPAEGWYEWQAVERVDPATGEIKRAKQPHFIRRADGALFGFAGLMSYRKDPKTGAALRSCAIVTTQAGRAAGADPRARAPRALGERAERMARPQAGRCAPGDRARPLAPAARGVHALQGAAPRQRHRARRAGADRAAGGGVRCAGKRTETARRPARQARIFINSFLRISPGRLSALPTGRSLRRRSRGSPRRRGSQRPLRRSARSRRFAHRNARSAARPGGGPRRCARRAAPRRCRKAGPGPRNPRRTSLRRPSRLRRAAAPRAAASRREGSRPG